MNEVMGTMRAHSSVRAFTTEPLDEALVREAVAAAQMAATSSHIQAYSVLLVTDEETRRKLVSLTGGQPYVAGAAAFFVISGDIRRHRLVAARAGVSNAQNLETFMLALIDASLFAQNLSLAFESLGLGICYIGGLRNELPDVDRLLELPAGVLPFYGLCAGHIAEKPAVKPRLPVDAVLFRDRYPSDGEMLAQIEARRGDGSPLRRAGTRGAELVGRDRAEVLQAGARAPGTLLHGQRRGARVVARVRLLGTGRGAALSPQSLPEHPARPRRSRRAR